jgi:hypothetical protein
VVAIDPAGRGDITRTHERWRADGIAAGGSSPALEDGKLYVFDGDARLLALDAETGGVLWKTRVGRSAKCSPVSADGKIFVGESDGRVAILRPGGAACATLSDVQLSAGVAASAAVANGRIYLVTRDELYCVGFKAWSGLRGTAPPEAREEPPPAGEPPAYLAVAPADIVLYPGQGAVLTARLFDAKGRFLRSTRAEWSVEGIRGAVTESGRFTSDKSSGFADGRIVARVDSLSGVARARIVQPMPFTLDFESLGEGASPAGWVGASSRLVGARLERDNVLRMVVDDPQAPFVEAFFGLPDWHGYTLEADVLSTESHGNLPDIALVNSGYQLALQGNLQRLRLVSWAGAPRLERAVELPWKAGVWYRMKLRAEVDGEVGLLRGKVWPRGEEEPAAWTLETQDPRPNPGGSPGFQAYASGVRGNSPGAGVHLDNVQVRRNAPEGK